MVQIKLRVTEEMATRLLDAAARSGHSRNGLIRACIDRGLEDAESLPLVEYDTERHRKQAHAARARQRAKELLESGI